MSDYEHNTIRIWVSGSEYNNMFKFKSFDELVQRIKNNDNVPSVDSFVTEARREDNIIAINEPWKDVLDKLICIFNYNDS